MATHPTTLKRARPLGLLLALLALGCDDDDSAAERAFCRDQGTLCERAEVFCDNAGDCDKVQLLINGEQCLQQVAEALLQYGEVQDCRQCVTSLTCPGMDKIVQGELTIQDLCPKCSSHLGVSRERGTARSHYVLIQGIGKAPPEPVEGEDTAGGEERAKPEPSTAPQSAPAAPGAPAPPTVEPASAQEPAKPVSSANTETDVPR